MNESLTVNVHKRVTLNCCNEDKKCEQCKPIWQRTMILDNLLLLWFPVIQMNNKVLKRISRSENGFLIEQETGIWFVDERMAIELAATKKEAEAIEEICNVIRRSYQSSLEEEKPECDEVV